MTNYMGKDRLMKILFHYILGRYGEAMYKDIVSVIREYEIEKYYIEQQRVGKALFEQKHEGGAFYTYDRMEGPPGCNEWIYCCCACAGHHFDVEVCGAKIKRVSISDSFYNENLQRMCKDKFFTFYDENFVPKPNETLLRGDTVQIPVLFKDIKPFTDENTIYKGINRDVCVCYDIAKNA